MDKVATPALADLDEVFELDKLAEYHPHLGITPRRLFPDFTPGPVTGFAIGKGQFLRPCLQHRQHSP